MKVWECEISLPNSKLKTRSVFRALSNIHDGAFCGNGQRLMFDRVRSSLLQMFFKIGVLKKFAIFIGKRLC